MVSRKRGRGGSGSNPPVIIGAAVLAVVVFALGFYFFYWTKTPSYAVNSVKESIADRKSTKLETYIDLDSVYSLAYRDLVYAQTGKNIIGAMAVDSTRNDMVDMMKALTIFALESDRAEEIDEFDYQVSEVEKMFAAGFIKMAKAIKDNYTLQDIVIVSHRGDQAHIEATVYHQALNKNFVIKATMTNRGYKHWVVKRIDNVKQLMQQGFIIIEKY